MTPFGIEPATFRFVAQHLNHCANTNNNTFSTTTTINTTTTTTAATTTTTTTTTITMGTGSFSGLKRPGRGIDHNYF